METIAVIDYGMGNLRSVVKAIEHVAEPWQTVRSSDEPKVIAGADRIVFPGQGAMRDCMAELALRGLERTVRELLHTRPFLGICMGLQILLERSEEDPDTPGLGLLAGEVHRLPRHERVSGERIKIPHMGWNNVHITMQHPLWQGIDDRERFYFVHSYVVAPLDPSIVAGTTHYGSEFACAIADRSLFAVQFHPEKSERAGLRLLKNFLQWDPS